MRGWLAMYVLMMLCSPALQAHAQLRVAVGMTQRDVNAPSDAGPRKLALGPTPAVMLGVAAAAHSGNVDLGVDISYRSSLAGHVRDADGGPNSEITQTAVRSHQLQAGARAGLCVGTASVALFAGYSLRAFASVAELRLPRFTLHGPVARIELELPLPAAGLRLRLAPEVQWLPAITDALRAMAAIRGSALAVGGEAQLQLPLSLKLKLLLDYRESHAFAAPSFSDAERYLMLGASYDWL